MSTQNELAVTYDLPKEFFKLWLDKGMNYSCALYQSIDDSLEQAQSNKLNFFYESIKLNRNHRVLDIGCGWGGNLCYLYREKGMRNLAGITLSKAQYESMLERLPDDIELECVSYEHYKPKEKFDALVSIGMFEHLATPEETRLGRNIDIYRNYFRLAWEWSEPGAYFGLQSVTSLRYPRDLDALKEIGWTTKTIFPGAVSPRLENIVVSMSPYWEVVEVHTRRKHYERTAIEWLNRLDSNELNICERWGEEVYVEYQRYLESCVMAFSKGYQSLAQLVLRRVDNISN